MVKFVRIVGYARVSSREQSFTYALEQQIKRLKDYGVSEVISDVESGRSDDRSGFNQLTELVAHGNLTIIATRTDRLSRSIISLKSFFSLCDRHNVSVVILDDAIDTSTAAGKFHLNMLGALAEMESDRISERVLHGHNYHRQRGAAYYPIFGYFKEGDKLYVHRSPFLYCDGQEWSRADIARLRIENLMKLGTLGKTVLAMRDKFGNGLSQNRIGGMSEWMKNPILRGHTSYLGGKEIILNTHEALMSESEWAIVNEIITSNAKRNGRKGGSTTHSFSGLIRCECCKELAYFQGCKSNRSRGDSYFQCRDYKEKRTGCTNKQMVRQSVIEDYAIKHLINYVDKICNLETLDCKPDGTIAKLEMEKANLMSIPSPSNVIITAIAEIDSQIQRQRLESQLATGVKTESIEQFIEVFKDPLFWTEYLCKKLSPSEMRSYYHKWIKVIWIKNGQITGIEFNF